MDEEERKIQMDDASVSILHIASGEISLFVDLWEAKPCLWDPE